MQSCPVFNSNLIIVFYASSSAIKEAKYSWWGYLTSPYLDYWNPFYVPMHNYSYFHNDRPFQFFCLQGRSLTRLLRLNAYRRMSYGSSLARAHVAEQSCRVAVLLFGAHQCITSERLSQQVSTFTINFQVGMSSIVLNLMPMPFSPRVDHSVKASERILRFTWC